MRQGQVWKNHEQCLLNSRVLWRHLGRHLQDTQHQGAAGGPSVCGLNRTLSITWPTEGTAAFKNSSCHKGLSFTLWFNHLSGELSRLWKDSVINLSTAIALKAGAGDLMDWGAGDLNKALKALWLLPPFYRRKKSRNTIIRGGGRGRTNATRTGSSRAEAKVRLWGVSRAQHSSDETGCALSPVLVPSVSWYLEKPTAELLHVARKSRRTPDLLA